LNGLLQLVVKTELNDGIDNSDWRISSTLLSQLSLAIPPWVGLITADNVEAAFCLTAKPRAA